MKGLFFGLSLAIKGLFQYVASHALVPLFLVRPHFRAVVCIHSFIFWPGYGCFAGMHNMLLDNTIARKR